MTDIQIWGFVIGIVIGFLLPVTMHLFGNFHMVGFDDSPVAWAHERYLVPTAVFTIGSAFLCMVVPVILGL